MHAAPSQKASSVTVVYDSRRTYVTPTHASKLTVTRAVNVSDVIDTHRVGAFQVRAFLLCAAVLFVDGFDVQGITYVATAISQDWGLARGALGPTFSAGLFGVMLGALLLAPLADRIGRRRVIIWSCVAFGVCTLATVLVGSSRPRCSCCASSPGSGSAPRCRTRSGSRRSTRRRSGARSIVMFVASGISLGAIGGRHRGGAARRAVRLAGRVRRRRRAAAACSPRRSARWLPESIRFAAAVPARQAEAKRLLRKIKPELGDRRRRARRSRATRRRQRHRRRSVQGAARPRDGAASGSRSS